MFSNLQHTGYKLWEEKRLEVILMVVSLLIPFFSFGIYVASFPKEAKGEEIQFGSTHKVPNTQEEKTLFVDVSGAVLQPDMYEVSKGARLKEAIKKAGGLSLKADIRFFQQNFNLARILTDQEKIYVPTVDEVEEGLFTEESKKLQSGDIGKEEIEENAETSSENGLINPNTATLEELDLLPNIGKVTAQKIIDNRPYKKLDELVTKKALSKTTFEKIKDLLGM